MAPVVLSLLGTCTPIVSGLPGDDGGSKATSVSEVFGMAACPNILRSLVATCAMGSQRRGDGGFLIMAACRIQKSLSAFLMGDHFRGGDCWYSGFRTWLETVGTMVDEVG